MSDFTFTEQELSDLKDVFFTEAEEILQSFIHEVLNLETGIDRDNALKTIQRHLHTLKGNSRALGFTCVNTLSHRSEDLLKAVQDRGGAVEQGLIDLLFAIADTLHTSIDAYKAQQEASLNESLIERIASFISTSGNGGSGGRHDAGGALYDVVIEAAKTTERKQERSATQQQKGDGVQTLRVESQRIDKIMNLVGELVIGRSMVGQISTELEERSKKDELVKRLGDANAFMEKTLSQLQKNVMKIRMLPISQVFRKFPRVVRDLALEKGKNVQLVLRGEKTELDKSILDVIGEPLIHLVRNAVDHGIEHPVVRTGLGKSEQGTVILEASHEGNQIVITVSDDGAGLDPDKLRKKAVEKGIKSPDEADRMADEEAFELIFVSGFSTADVVTDISGRGFGMDIVRTTIESLKGRIQVRSSASEGATFTVRLPLTLAIIRAMLFSLGNRLFALPMSSIERINRIKAGDVQTITGKSVLRFRDKVISLISLKEALQIPDLPDHAADRTFAIIVGLGERLYGFLVDRLIGQQELVIKALDDHWGTVDCTSGASILGSGKVVLILDSVALIVKEMKK